MSEAVTLDNDYERMIPEFHQGSLIYAEHITRYMAAQPFAKRKIVLDIASGSGYGTRLLAEKAKFVYGVDINEKAVAYARHHYGAKNIEYKVGETNRIPLTDNSVDVVVTFETIEHVADYNGFVAEINRVLRPNGQLILSTPNDLEFAEGNHFHTHEFVYEELVSLLKPHFQYINSYFQVTGKLVMLGDASVFSQPGPVKPEFFNFATVKPGQYLYFYLVCSNKKVRQKIGPLAAVGEHYSDRQLTKLYSDLNEKSKEIEILKRKLRSLERKHGPKDS